MKYLFFDIECAGVYKTVAKICAFGYCLTDENFQILEKEDILINPQGSFHLTDRKGSQGLVLPYSYGEFKKYPVFPKLVDRIYALLHDPDTLVVGHATMNDVKYLNLETKRFSLPSFCFEFADTQFLYMNKIGEFNRQFGLGAIAEALGVEFTAHKAADDAFATMKVAEAICKEEGLKLPELIKKYKIKLGKIENYEVTQTRSAASEKYHKDAAKAKEKRERARASFHEFVDKNRRLRNKNGVMKGLSVSFSRLQEERLDESKELVLETFKKGGWFSYKVDDCNFYVCLDGENGPRKQKAEENGAKAMTAEQFRSYLSNLGE